MVKGERKPIEEIIGALEKYSNVLNIGCGGCVSVCLTGGDREARQLAEELSMPRYFRDGRTPEFTVSTIERQCERDWL